MREEPAHLTGAAHSAIRYRPEIDGLRAVAVVPVVLFHAGVGSFTGGYVGVDVFFVISGYLITSIILADKMSGKFTIAGFYERRARRILPALFLVMLVSTPFAWHWMTPHHLKSFAQSMVAAAMFMPNIYFLLKSSYFDIDADEKPLLHTWSLGVEEQYYLGFPLFVLLCWRWGAATFAWLVGLVALLSLGLSEWASQTHPIGNFFLLPTRAWELALGSLLGVAGTTGSAPPSLALATRNLLALLGFALIAIPVFRYDQATPFPSVYALAPTVGAALVIFCAEQDTVVGKALSLKLVKGIGLISYSLYLWHQPLFAFARLLSTEKPSPYLMGGLTMLAVFFAYATWRFVERPMRNRSRFSRYQIFSLAFVGSMLLIGLGLAGHFKEGFPERLNAGQREIMAFADDPKRNRVGYPPGECFLTPEQDSSAFGKCVDEPAGAKGSALLWGDSHAAHLYPGLKALLGGRSLTLTTLTSSACPPLLNYGGPKCRELNAFVLARIVREQPGRVILAAVWGNYEWERLKDTLSQLKSAGIKQIQVVGPVPRWIPSLPVVLTRYGLSLSEIPERITMGLDPAIKQIDKGMRSLAQANAVDYLSPFAALCDEKGCLIRTAARPESMMHWDVSHLTKAGSEYLVNRLW